MDSTTKKQMTLGLIVGNRGFFPDHLALSGRREMQAVLEPVVITDSRHLCSWRR